MLLPLIAATLSTGLCLQAEPQGTMEVPLTFHKFEDTSLLTEIYFMAMSSSRVTQDKTTPISSYQIPENGKSPSLFKATIYGKDYVVVAAKSATSKKSYDLVWIDWNGDKKIEEDEGTNQLKGSKTTDTGEPEDNYGMGFFMPTSFPEGMEPVAFQTYGATRIMTIPAGYYSGTISVGAGTMVAIVDANLNGKLGDGYNRSERGESSDMLLIDVNGNGKFDPMDYSQGYDMAKMEVFPFLKLTQLKGYEFYELKGDTERKSLTVTPYTGPMSTIEFKGGTADYAACTAETILIAYANGNTISIPSIKTTDLSIQYHVNDSNGQEWTIGINGSAKDLLAANKKTDFQAGLPLKIDLTTNKDAFGFEFSLAIKDVGGHELGNLADKKGARPTLPTLVISDAKGKVVKKLTFSYG